MRHKSITPLSFFLILVVLIGVFAIVSKAEKPNANGEKKRVFALPDKAVRVEDNLYYLGKAKDKDGKEVEGYAIIHYKDEKAKGGGSTRNKSTQCYGFLADGAKWKAVEPWVVNPLNSRGLLDSFIFDNVTSDIAKWEDAADGTVGNGGGIDILGNGVVTQDVLVADTVSPDNVNEVYFADVTDSNAIAVTIVWGIFSGPPFQRSLVEWDQVYDDVDYDWSSSGEVAKMDFENIATHELGHSVGMKDLYTTSCSQETMYGYASNGETIKRDLNAGDVKGINSLY
ncbi:matrixin family metalloprotease [Candidatus Roizmanbacteria bacterium]|nr:matrixin family metalloprotease [Candidatus Roizmanbacteria bacterium]